METNFNEFTSFKALWRKKCILKVYKTIVINARVDNEIMTTVRW